MCVCCFSFQMGPTGKAVGVEHIKELVHESIRNVQEDDPTLLSSGRVKLVGELTGILMLVLSCQCISSSCLQSSAS